MASEEHVQIIWQGAAVWNEWRKKNPELIPDLTNANLTMARLAGTELGSVRTGGRYLNQSVIGMDLRGMNLSDADLSQADLRDADLSQADLRDADLQGADLRGVNLSGADLSQADLGGQLDRTDLSGADLTRAILREANFIRSDLGRTDLSGADLSEADLSDAKLIGAELMYANLRGADLTRAILVRAFLREANLSGAKLGLTRLGDADLSDANLIGTDLTRANLSSANLSEADLEGSLLVQTDLRGASLVACNVYGASVWDIKVDDQTKQQNLIIARRGDPVITVDNIKVAQFVYLLLNNKEIRDVIDTIGRKLVLILGRFTPERKRILDALRDELRIRDYLPVVFDFEKPSSRDLTETISTLAHMARFIIADLTEAKSLPQELGVIVPNLPSVVVQPIILRAVSEYAMFEHFRRYPWVLEVLKYDDTPLIGALAEQVVASVQAKLR
jgi:uncharacterized protein YjbI with pentapeptide repeats